MIKKIIDYINAAVNVFIKVKNPLMYFSDLFGVNKEEWVMETRFGKILLRPNSVDRWVATENLVLDQFKLGQFEKDEFDTVIDLGANIGDSTLPLYKYFENSRIIAFEPHPENFKYLIKNVDLNNMGDRVEIINAAVSDSEKSHISLYLNVDSAASSTYLNDNKDTVTKVENLNFSFLNKYIKKDTLLKMDIEGAECGLFKADYLNLIKKFKAIIFEHHNLDKDCNLDKIEGFLNENGFKYKKYGQFISIS